MLIATLLAVLSAQGGPMDPWGSSKPGSWVLFEETQRSPSFDSDRKVKWHFKLAKVSDQTVELYQGNTKDGSEPDIFFSVTHTRAELSWLTAEGVKVRNRKDEPKAEVRVGDKTLSCQVHSLEFVHRDAKPGQNDDEFVDRLKVWESSEVPGRVVRVEGSLHEGDPKNSQVWTFQGSVTDFAEKVNVGGRDLACAKLEIHATGPGKRTITYWLTKEVPGLVARWKTVEGEGKKQVTIENVVSKFQFAP